VRAVSEEVRPLSEVSEGLKNMLLQSKKAEVQRDYVKSLADKMKVEIVAEDLFTVPSDDVKPEATSADVKPAETAASADVKPAVAPAAEEKKPEAAPAPADEKKPEVKPAEAPKAEAEKPAETPAPEQKPAAEQAK
ncbi:MAG: hypothetical protein IJU32_09555, partial [Pyramidobacter sp.]|nr:hypothetical protein [Pyramidobacter sp.]